MTTKAGDAELVLEENTSTIKFNGSLRLANMKEYEKVTEFLSTNSSQSNKDLTLDFRDLKFLNSSGITTISLFVLNCKSKGNIKLTIKGSNRISWQQKSLLNFKRLWPELNLEIE
jgi:hypothetical protein